MSEWKECKIADAPFEIIDGDRGTNYPKQDEFNQNGYCLFLNAKNVTTDGFAFNECYFISKEKDKILRKGKLQRNDIVLTPKLGYCPEWFYFLARNDDFRDYAIQNMTGTSGRQRVSGESIAQYEIAIPIVKFMEQFDEFAGPVMEHIKHNSFQIRTLSRLRGTLLPKLMSGEVRVKI